MTNDAASAFSTVTSYPEASIWAGKAGKPANRYTRVVFVPPETSRPLACSEFTSCSVWLSVRMNDACVLAPSSTAAESATSAPLTILPSVTVGSPRVIVISSAVTPERSKPSSVPVYAAGPRLRSTSACVRPVMWTEKSEVGSPSGSMPTMVPEPSSCWYCAAVIVTEPPFGTTSWSTPVRLVLASRTTSPDSRVTTLTLMPAGTPEALKGSEPRPTMFRLPVVPESLSGRMLAAPSARNWSWVMVSVPLPSIVIWVTAVRMSPVRSTVPTTVSSMSPVPVKLRSSAVSMSALSSVMLSVPVPLLTTSRPSTSLSLVSTPPRVTSAVPLTVKVATASSSSLAVTGSSPVTDSNTTLPSRTKPCVALIVSASRLLSTLV